MGKKKNPERDMSSRKMHTWPTGTWKSTRPLIIREMQIKTTIKDHFTLVTVASIKKTRDKRWWGCREKGTLGHCWECKLVQPLWKTVWRFLKKIKNRATIWSSSPTSAYLSKGNENGIKEVSVPPCSWQRYSQLPTNGNNRSTHW